jgi:diphthamide biosynthesis methyltransferase
MSSGRLKYLPPRFMTINTAVEQLLEAENEKKEVATNTSLNHF